MKSIFSRFLSFARKLLPYPSHADLDDEIQFHLDMSIGKKVAAGMDPNKARREAHKEFGGRLYTKEACQMSWGAHRLDDLLSDLSLAFRRITKQPQYSLPIIIILAISMGVCATLFNVAQQTFMNPSSYPRANEVIEICVESDLPGGVRYKSVVSAKVYKPIRELKDTFASLGYLFTRHQFLYHDNEVRDLWVRLITPETWDVFKTQPRFGQVFTQEYLEQGNTEITVISYEEAVRLFVDPAKAIGQSVRLDNTYFTIIGVMPKSFRSLYPSAYWLPLIVTESMTSAERPWKHSGAVICRLKKGLPKEQLEVRLKSIMQQLCEEDAQFKRLRDYMNRVLVTKPHSQIESKSKLSPKTLTLILFTLGVSLFVIGCLHTGSILMTNLLQRYHEIVTSSALGAKRKRINQQLLTEYVLLFICGAICSLILLFSLTQVAEDWMTSSKIILPTTYGFIVVQIAIGSGLCGMLVFRKTHSKQLENRLREHQTTTTFKSRSLTASIFIQCWVTVFLMLASLLLAINVHRILSADYGFEYRNRIVAHTQFPTWKFDDQTELRKREISKIGEQLSHLPGVIRCGAINTLPQSASQYYSSWGLRPEELGMEPDPSATLQIMSLQTRGITDDLLQAMDITLIKGRWLEPSDTETPQMEIIVEQKFVDEIMNEREPIDFIFPENDEKQFKIVGVVENVRFYYYQSSYANPWTYHAYQALEESHYGENPNVEFVLEVDRKHAPKHDVIRKLIRSIDGDLGVNVKTYSETIKEKYRFLVRARNTVVLLSVTTLLISLYGFYSFLNYRVCLQKKDLGIRISLGAKPERLIRNYLLRNAIPVVSGLVMGCITLVLCIQPLKEQFTEIDPTDPLPYVLTVSILVCIYVVASIIPIMQIRKLSIREVLASNG